MKGLDFVRRLREAYSKAQLPVIILTARRALALFL
jgi:DNA-binding response OmpR family regulator